jgi:ribosomal protein L11 methyltransferase
VSDGAPSGPTSQPELPHVGERKPLNPRLVTVIALVAVGAAALADYSLATQNFTLALIYIPPLLALAWIAGWRFAAACTLLAAVTNFTVDATLGGLPNTLGVHAANAALFILCVPAERLVATLRFMLEYTRRGDAWKAAIQPARIGQRVVLVPVWRREEAAGVVTQPDDVQVLLDPGQAFGTGSHPTTLLCVGLLEQHVRSGDKVLDLGCGTGSLSLAALKLGAASALAADIQAEAVQATLANARLNDLAGRMEVRLGSLEEVVRPLLEHHAERFNITVSNILPDVIAGGLKAGMGQTLTPEGVLIISGFKPEHEKRLRGDLDEAGLEVLERRQKEEWMALAARRKT